MNLRNKNSLYAATALTLSVFLLSACEKKSPQVATQPTRPSAEVLEAEAKEHALEEFKRHWTNLNGCWYSYTPAKQHVPVITNMSLKVVPTEVDEQLRHRGVTWAGEVEFQTDRTRTFFFSTKKWTDWKPVRVPMAYLLSYDTNRQWKLNNEFTMFQMPTPAQLQTALSVR
jgi:hypothetical protein